MKKHVKAVLAALTALALTACSSAGSVSAKPGNGSEEVKEETAAEETEPETEAEEETEEAEETQPAEQRIDIESLAAIDNDDCKVTVTGISLEGDQLIFSTEFENRSADLEMYSTVANVLLNGVQADTINTTYAAEPVMPGKKDIFDWVFSAERLKEFGGSDITDISITLEATDSPSYYMSSTRYMETVHAYPKGEENAVQTRRQDSESDVVLIDNDIAKVVLFSIGEGEYDNPIGSVPAEMYCMDLYVENKTDMILTFSSGEDGILINGNAFEIIPHTASGFEFFEVFKGAITTNYLGWYTYELEDNDITDIEQIEFVLNAKGDSSYETLFSEKITVNP